MRKRRKRRRKKTQRRRHRHRLKSKSAKNWCRFKRSVKVPLSFRKNKKKSRNPSPLRIRKQLTSSRPVHAP